MCTYQQPNMVWFMRQGTLRLAMRGHVHGVKDAAITEPSAPSVPIFLRAPILITKMLPFRCKAFLPSSRHVHHSISRGHLCRATRVLYEWLQILYSKLHAITSNRMPFLHPPPSTARILGLSTTIAVSLVLVNMARSLFTSPNYDNGNNWPGLRLWYTGFSAPRPTIPYNPRHMHWPYTAADFAGQESTSDSCFYSNPRFVTHIDDHAIATLRRYYAAVLPGKAEYWISAPVR